VTAPYLLITRSAEYEARLRALLGRRLDVVHGEFLTFGMQAVTEAIEGRPRIVLLGPALNFDETRELVNLLRDQFPGIGLIVVHEQRRELEEWMDDIAVHAVLQPAATDEVTLGLLDRLAKWLVDHGHAVPRNFDEVPEDEVELSTPGSGPSADDVYDDILETPTDAAVWTFPPVEPGASVEAIAVVAPKGGQGKTTIAINLAAGLAEVAPNSVVLVDADLQFGDITAALALSPERTIVDAVADAAADELVLKTALTYHRDGFFVVASAPSPELGDSIPAGALGQLIDRLRASFRYVIVDTTPGLGEHTLTTLEHVTDAAFVTNMSVPALRAMRTEFELLDTVGLLPSSRLIVLNQTDKLSGLSIRDVENILGAPVDVQIPKSSAVLLSANRGVPLIQDDVRDPAAKAIRSIVLRTAPDAFPKRSKIQRRRRSDESQ
jgi:Flp pilus assembly CpaE family ATPase